MKNVCREKAGLWGRITNCHQGDRRRLRRDKVTASVTSPAPDPVGARVARAPTGKWHCGGDRIRRKGHWHTKGHSRLLAVIETCDHSCINLCLHLCHHPSFPAGGFCVCFAASALFRRMKVRRTLWATPEPRVPLSIKLTATPTHQRSPLPSRPGVFAADVCTHPHMLTLVITDFHVPFFLKCFCGCICPCTAWKLAWSPFFCPKSKSWAVTTFASPDLISSNKRTKTFKPRAVGNSSTHPVH